MRLLGIDFGERRVGVAISDPLGLVASPNTIITHDDNDEVVIKQLLNIINEKKIVKIIIGIPYNMNGSIGFQAERVIEFGEKLQIQTKIPIIYEDERETSKQVKEILKTIKSKQTRIDDRAAAIILQNYLDYN